MNQSNIIKLGEGVYHINDGVAYCTLIVGSEKALLFDTGCGTRNLWTAVNGLTNRPLIVVNSHGHFDHTFGNYLFDSVFMHRDDMEIYKIYTSSDFRKKLASGMPGNFEIYADLVYKSKINFVNEGDSFDLGDRTLEVIYVPGHTKGCIALFDRKKRILFGGDTISQQVWMFLEESTDMSTYIESLKKIKSLDFDIIIASHSEGIYDKGIVDKLIHCAENIDISKSTKFSTPLVPYDGLMYAEGGEPFKSMDFVSIVYNKDKL
jgi:glyoxylase-like metal-dependent hydrolase (beta-lactamase superfamily II)